MLAYVVICCLMLYPVGLVFAGKYTGRNTDKIGLIAACCILWGAMALRGNKVGVDTKYYTHVFSQFDSIPLFRVFSAKTYATESGTWTMDFEPGCRLYNKLVSYFTSWPQGITIANSTLILVLLYRFIKHNSQNFLLSIWLYVTLGTYQTEMNVTRNAIAILIVYNALHYARERRFIPYCCWCLVGASFHVSVLAFIPVYFLFRMDTLSLKKCVWIVLGFVGMGLLFSFLSSSLASALPARFAKYIGSSGGKFEKIAVGGVNAGLVCLVYFFMNREERELVFRQCHHGMILILLNLCAFGVSLGSGYAARIAALFGPYVMVFLPEMLGLIQTQKRRAWITLLVTVLVGVQYVLRLCVNNIGGTIPYSFFWQ